MPTDDRRHEIEEALETWPDATAEDLRRIITVAEDVAEQAVAEFNATPGAAYLACQTEYGCDWKWDVQADEPTARVYDCDGETIRRIDARVAGLHEFADQLKNMLGF